MSERQELLEIALQIRDKLDEYAREARENCRLIQEECKALNQGLEKRVRTNEKSLNKLGGVGAAITAMLTVLGLTK